MNFLIFFRVLELLCRKKRRELPGAGISLLVPFHPDTPGRAHVWRWLREYWENELPGAQICIGVDRRRPFSKSTAVNRAARKATGDIFVILDADTYLPGSVVQEAADRIREARAQDKRLWLIPYRHLYRLTKVYSRAILRSNPRCPLRVPHPPEPWMIENSSGSTHGHWFGALIQVLPREAWELVGGMDERFRGWGGEDVSFMRAVDTIYSKHKSLDRDVTHLWHERIGRHWDERMWAGQEKPKCNEGLAIRYLQHVGDPERMHQLVREGLPRRKRRR
jgi:hypothetical protein